MIVVIGWAAGSALIAWLGYLLVKCTEIKPGESAFMSFFSPRWCGYNAGWALFWLGVLLFCLGTPMAYIARR